MFQRSTDNDKVMEMMVQVDTVDSKKEMLIDGGTRSRSMGELYGVYQSSSCSEHGGVGR